MKTAINVSTVLAVLISSFGAYGATAKINGITWTYTTVTTTTTPKITTVTLKATDGKPCISDTTVSELTIPSTLGGYSVTRLDGGAFTNCLNLTRVNLPATVTKIYRAFTGCTKLETVAIATGTTTLDINESAFRGCTAFTTFENSSANFAVENGILYNADKTKLVRCPTALTSVSIPNTVAVIGQNAFAYALIREVKLPGALESIFSTAFNHATELNDFSIAAESTHFTTIDGVLYTKDGKTLQLCPAARTELAIVAGVTNVAEYAVYGCANMQKLSCPSSLAYLYANSFIGITDQLTEVTFHGNVPARQSEATLGGLPIVDTLKVRYNPAYATNWTSALTALKYKNTEAIVKSGILISVF